MISCPITVACDQVTNLEVRRLVVASSSQAITARLGRPDAVPAIGRHTAYLTILGALDGDPRVLACLVLETDPARSRVGRAV